MNIAGSVALVTGANRGIGRHFAQELLARGAAKVYATARRPELIDLPGAQVLRLDITDSASIRAAAAVATDVTLLVNNAGIDTGTPLLTGDMEAIRAEMETHFFGTLQVVRAFTPSLVTADRAAVINVLSALSWFSHPGASAYAAAKSAEWSMTNGIRLELAEQGVLVQGVVLGAADTDISARYDGIKIAPLEVVKASLDGVEAEAWEVLVDDWSRHVKASLASDPQTFYQGLLGGAGQA